MRAKPFPKCARKVGPRMLEELERPETQELQEHLIIPRLEIAPPSPLFVENDQRQRRRMVIALVVLLIALGLVLIKDRDFWFPASDVADSEAIEDSTAESVDEPAATATTGASTVVTPAAPKVRKKAHPAPVTVAKAAPPTVPSAPAVTASRAVLPPLRVEVVAGDQRQMVKPGNTSVKVELQAGTPPMPTSEVNRAGTEMASAAKPVTTAGDRVSMSTDTRQAVTRPVRPEYPLLARQMKVQGAVVLLVLIDKDGSIQNLQVESGPAILADAAREAVKQWRFKPYFQDGQPTETEARVTVDFTIRAN
jgi:periplasmic protein TonB